MLNSLLVAWALFFIIKAINRTERMASSGVEQLRGQLSENSDT
jgi:large conductance mechanosensitive channel